MITRERDERDLLILQDYEAGLAVNDLVRKYKSTTPYVKRLIVEALNAED